MSTNSVDSKYYTKSVHAGMKPDVLSGAVTPPIYQTSTYIQQSPGVHKGWDYSRAGNPTRDALEAGLAEIEGAKYGLSFSSGLAAEQAIMQVLLLPGDEVLVCDDVYGGTGRLFRNYFEKFGIKFHFIDMSDPAEVSSKVTSKTKVIWVETPTNPTLKIIDIEKMAEVAKKSQATLVVDNTFASPVFQRPLELGADVVVHSTTKYIGGHSDVIGGAAITNNQDLYTLIKRSQFEAGSVPSPMECFLLHRSLKTLAVRMNQHHQNSVAVADFLSSSPKVKKVYFPGLDSHPNFDVATRQMSGFSGMVSFDIDGNYDDVLKFLSRLEVFVLAESLGGVESLVNHPEKMTHASVPEPLRKQLGIGSTMLRLSCGIEATDDLVMDLKQALN